MADDLLNQSLGKYRLLAELGRGGFATVYRALDTTLDRQVALHVLDPRRGAVLTDFGFARLVGTPAYIAPEM